jgi:hypothetical protein
MQLILFTSADPGRAAMAASFFNAGACPSRACAIAAVAEPSGPFDDHVLAVMKELSSVVLLPPTRLTDQLEACAAVCVWLGCPPETNSAPTSAHRIEWEIEDPCLQSIEGVRHVRDAIRSKTEAFVEEEQWQPVR